MIDGLGPLSSESVAEVGSSLSVRQLLHRSFAEQLRY